MRPPWHESIRLPSPLRDVRVLRVLTAEAARREEVEDQVRAAYERGRIEGEQALGEQLVRQRQETQALFHGVLDSLRNVVPQVVREAEQTLAALTLEIARKLVADLPIQAELVEAVVRDALGQVEQASEFTVLLHAEDLALLQRLQSPLLASGNDARSIEFRSSQEVTRGGCIVQTRFGTVDARRETKIELLRSNLQS